MEKSRENELKLFQLMLGNRANSGMPPSSSMETAFYPSWNQVLGIMTHGFTHECQVLWEHSRPPRKGCLKVLMGTLSFIVMGNTKHCKLCRTESIFLYTSITVLPTWPVIICKITDIPKWENTPVQNKTRKAIIESSLGNCFFFGRIGFPVSKL